MGGIPIEHRDGLIGASLDLRFMVSPQGLGEDGIPEDSFIALLYQVQGTYREQMARYTLVVTQPMKVMKSAV